MIETTLSPAITGKYNLALTQSGFQKISDRASTLVLNEDNLEEIKSFLEDTKTQ